MSINDYRVPPALAELDFKKKSDIDAVYRSLFDYEQPDSFGYGCREAMAAFLPGRNQILLTRPCMYRDDDICYSETYTLKKRTLVRIPFCTKYYLRANPELLVHAENTGCCGTSGWEIKFFNLSTKKLVNPGLGCGPDFCRSFLFVWLPDLNKFITVSLEVDYQYKLRSYAWLQIGIIDKAGEIQGIGTIKAVSILSGDSYTA